MSHPKHWDTNELYDLHKKLYIPPQDEVVEEYFREELEDTKEDQVVTDLLGE